MAKNGHLRPRPSPCGSGRPHRRRALHMHVLTFAAREDRAVIAGHLRRARRCLREKVDDIDLVAIGVEA